MRKILAWMMALTLSAGTATAALPAGVRAPDFSTNGALAGKPFSFHLKQELRKGPVVLYFFPRAFTEGCTLEARAFSEAHAEFRKAGAQVIGMSADDVPTLKRFSVEACRNAFPVASASPMIIQSYDVVLKSQPSLSNRTSFVIDRSGRIRFVHSDSDWSQHVQKTLAAVRSLRK